MGSSSPCAALLPPFPLCLESTPHPSGHRCSSPAGTDRWNWAPPEPGHVGGQFPHSAHPMWGLSRPCILLEPLSPSRARGCPLGSRTLGSHVPSAPQGSRQGHKRTSSHWRQQWEPGSATELCQHCCAHGLLDRKLGDWGAAWGHICCWKSLLWVRGFALQGLWATDERI